MTSANETAHRRKVPADRPHVVVVVGVSDPWSYAVKPLMPARSKVRFQTKWDASPYQMCLCKRTRDGVTSEKHPTSLKKANLESATREGPDIQFCTPWADFVILMIFP